MHQTLETGRSVQERLLERLTHLRDFVFTRVALVAAVLSSAVDLALVAGLRGQAVLVVAALHVLAREAGARHAVAGGGRKQRSATLHL